VIPRAELEVTEHDPEKLGQAFVQLPPLADPAAPART
jgi:hypothetical protein